MVKNEVQIKRGITVTVNVGAKSIIYVKKIIFGILRHVVAKMVNI